MPIEDSPTENPTPPSEPTVQTPAEKEIIAEAKRYPALILMSTILKIAGIIFLIAGVILAIVQIFTAEGLGDKVFYFFVMLMLGILNFVIFYFLSEFIKVIVDIEENTRKVIVR